MQILYFMQTEIWYQQNIFDLFGSLSYKTLPS